jgi:hypothetical protein
MAGLAEAYTVMLQGLRLVNAAANRAQGALSNVTSNGLTFGRRVVWQLHPCQLGAMQLLLVDFL